jgi:hypothetical protein
LLETRALLAQLRRGRGVLAIQGLLDYPDNPATMFMAAWSPPWPERNAALA